MIEYWLVVASSIGSSSSAARAGADAEEQVLVQTRDSNRIDEFEALRGAMALWVVAGHVIHTVESGPSPAAWLRLLALNPYAVNVFIALSGFVIYALIDQKREPYGLYITRRALRLFPAYLFFLLLSILLLPMALGVLAPDVATNPRAAARFAYLSDGWREFWPHLAAHLLLLHGLVPQDLLPNAEYAFIGQAWSISVEWQFYLIAPLLYLAFERNAWLASLGVAAMAVATRLWLGGIANQGFIGFYLDYFLFGILAYLVWRRRAALSGRQFAGVVVACALGGVAALRYELSLGIWLFACAGTLLLHRAEGGWVTRLGRLTVCNPVAQFLGRISYSVYVSHMVVLYAAVWAMRAIWPDRPIGLAALMAATMAGTLLLSHVTYLWVERPGMQWGKSLRPFRRGVALPDPVVRQG